MTQGGLFIAIQTEASAPDSYSTTKSELAAEKLAYLDDNTKQQVTHMLTNGAIITKRQHELPQFKFILDRGLSLFLTHRCTRNIGGYNHIRTLSLEIS